MIRALNLSQKWFIHPWAHLLRGFKSCFVEGRTIVDFPNWQCLALSSKIIFLLLAVAIICVIILN
jgi:hypothetical protein